jgi:putative ABC transport system ATP-binding protein
MIDVKDAGKRYYLAGKPFYALRNVSFRVEPGDFVCISGTSGSGKSTLLNILAGILHPTEGEIVFEGKNLGKLSDRALSRFRGEKIGLVYQGFNLINRLTVFENVRAPLLFEKHGLRDARRRVEEILDRVGIGEKRNEYPQNLSGGQLQRAAIARAVIKRPALLLADEPTGNLDATTGLEIIRLFEELNRAGITVLVVSHDARFIEAAHSNLVLEFGELKRTGKGGSRHAPNRSGTQARKPAPAVKPSAKPAKRSKS